MFALCCLSSFRCGIRENTMKEKDKPAPFLRLAIAVNFSALPNAKRGMVQISRDRSQFCHSAISGLKI